MAVQIAECDHDSGVYRVQVPDGWWVNPTFTDAELGPVSACQFFGPEPFDVTTGNLDQPRPAGAAVSIEFIDGGCVGYLYGILSSREVIVAGLQGSITEEAGSPGGTEAFTYQYLVILAGPGDCGPADKAITGTTRREDAGDYDENTEILDTMMETIAVTFP